MSDDKPPGAYDTGGSGFDATRASDTSAAAPGAPEAAPAVGIPPTVEPASAGGAGASTAIPQPAWDRAVGAWISSHVRSSPITQGASGAWEHLNAVLPRLKALLEQELKT